MDDKFKKLYEWDEICIKLGQALNHLAPIITKEKELRQEIFDVFFPKPDEGVNKFPLQNKFKLQGTYKITRAIVEEKLPEISKIKDMKDVIKAVVNFKPVLDKKNYKKLSPEQQHIFDRALLIRATLPDLQIVKPKK